MNALGPQQELKGEKMKRENTTFPFCPFRLLLICFFRFLESATPLKAEGAELCTATSELEAILNEKPPKFSLVFLNMEMRVQPSLDLFSYTYCTLNYSI